MSTIGNALNALKQVILLQDRVERMEGQLENIADDIDGLADVAHDLDKRLVRIETMIEMTARAGNRPPEIEG